jgi:hypothetical protein
MNRFLLTIAVTAAGAAVIAAITLPAGADPTSADPDAQLVSCLRAHGADIPAGTQGVAIKDWVRAHESDGTALRAMKACDTGGPTELAACLRGQGLDVPTAIDELKPWILQHADDASAKPAFAACHFSVDAKRSREPATVKDFAACLRHNGADVPANLDGVELKTWVHDHASQDALKACTGDGPVEAKPDCGPGTPAPSDTKPAPSTAGTEAPAVTLTAEQ